ncbi:MAG: hypothetical protein AABY22_27785 [Nanoarchaeota archaeon]
MNKIKTAEEFKQDCKELNKYFDALSQQTEKDGGNLWIQLSDKFNAFEKKYTYQFTSPSISNCEHESKPDKMGMLSCKKCGISMEGLSSKNDGLQLTLQSLRNKFKNKYEYNLQMMNGEFNIYIQKDDVDLWSSLGNLTEHEAISEAMEYINRINPHL